MKNAKRFLTLCLALCMVLSVAVFAEGEPGTIKEITADGATIKDNGVSFELTCEDATNNGMYLILVLSEEGTPKDGNILYVNQVTADEDGAYFENVYPTEIGEETSYIYLAGAEGYKKLGEIIPNKEEVLPPPAELTVNAIGVDEDAYTVEGRTVTVDNALACKLGYKNPEGTYTAIASEENGDGTYSYNVPESVSEVVLVVKGDVNSDGKVNSGDYGRLNAVLLGRTTLNAEATFAADVNDDTKINSGDYGRLNAVLLGRTTMAW